MSKTITPKSGTLNRAVVTALLAGFKPVVLRGKGRTMSGAPYWVFEAIGNAGMEVTIGKYGEDFTSLTPDFQDRSWQGSLKESLNYWGFVRVAKAINNGRPVQTKTKP